MLFCSIFPLTSWPQSNPIIKPALSSSFQRFLQHGGADYAAFDLGNVRLQIPRAVMAAHGQDLMISHIGLQLDPVVYTNLSNKNNAHILHSLQRFIKDYNFFQTHKDQIATCFESRVFEKNIPYASYLPKEVNTLYIGEVHQVPGLAGEVAKLIRSLPKIYPNRRIYLATEFLPAAERVPFAEGSLVLDKQTINQILMNEYFPTTEVLYAAVATGIAVLGLEPEQAIWQKLHQKTHQQPTEKMYEDFAVSFEGMRWRNHRWAQYLRALRAADPEALIVVYAGFGHVGYHRDFNLPSIILDKSFVILFTTPIYLPLNNPFFRYMREEGVIGAAFRNTKQAKLVKSWRGSTPYNKIIGADMAVILHSQD